MIITQKFVQTFRILSFQCISTDCTIFKRLQQCTLFFLNRCIGSAPNCNEKNETDAEQQKQRKKKQDSFKKFFFTAFKKLYNRSPHIAISASTPRSGIITESRTRPTRTERIMTIVGSITEITRVIRAEALS